MSSFMAAFLIKTLFGLFAVMLFVYVPYLILGQAFLTGLIIVVVGLVALARLGE